MLTDSEKNRVKELHSVRNEDNKDIIDSELFIIYNKANMKGVVYDNNQ